MGIVWVLKEGYKLCYQLDSTLENVTQLLMKLYSDAPAKAIFKGTELRGDRKLSELGTTYDNPLVVSLLPPPPPSIAPPPSIGGM